MQAANTGGMSATEIQANQLQIDSAVSSITRIANTTTFDGLHLIDGSLNYITSGVQSNQITGPEHHGSELRHAHFGAGESECHHQRQDC